MVELHIFDLAALAADEVMVGFAGGGALVAGGTGAEIGSQYQARLDQIVEDVEYRGSRQGGTELTQFGHQLVGGAMTSDGVEGLEDCDPLSGTS